MTSYQSLLQQITIKWKDVTTTLTYNENGWTRIVNGTKESPCFACCTMTAEDVEEQLRALMEGIREQEYDRLLQQFAELGGKPEMFTNPPTEAQLKSLVTAMRKLKDAYPQFWEAGE